DAFAADGGDEEVAGAGAVRSCSVGAPAFGSAAPHPDLCCERLSAVRTEPRPRLRNGRSTARTLTRQVPSAVGTVQRVGLRSRAALRTGQSALAHLPHECFRQVVVARAGNGSSA